ncbi:nicotinamide-nucleotide amidohydrolase family protein [Paraglaciecola aestuariivivens]
MTETITQLAQRLVNALLAKGWQFTCAESCTGGGVGYAITGISGSSECFKKGFISYSNQAKHSMLGVKLATLAQYTELSNETVIEMAAGAAEQAKANLAVAISGIAGPLGGTLEKPVGSVWFGFYIDGQLSSEYQVFAGSREAVRLAAIEYALTHALALLDK